MSCLHVRHILLFYRPPIINRREIYAKLPQAKAVKFFAELFYKKATKSDFKLTSKNIDNICKKEYNKNKKGHRMRQRAKRKTKVSLGGKIMTENQEVKIIDPAN